MESLADTTVRNLVQCQFLAMLPTRSLTIAIIRFTVLEVTLTYLAGVVVVVVVVVVVDGELGRILEGGKRWGRKADYAKRRSTIAKACCSFIDWAQTRIWPPRSSFMVN